ncbi:MoaD/ThiS family protein [Natronorarus salvus]|uniref:MoaD/ThiS family protein n=1 Tax=Natronorarus salvus TaxID=3117733 RepID=UPI002F267E5D
MSEIRVTVRCYGVVRERVGERTVSLTLPPGATVSDALVALAERAPGIEREELLVMCEGSHVLVEDRETTELAGETTLSVSNPVGRE